MALLVGAHIVYICRNISLLVLQSCTVYTHMIVHGYFASKYYQYYGFITILLNYTVGKSVKSICM